MVKIDIGDFDQEKQVGTIDTDGNLETDSAAFRAVAQPFIENGIHSVYPFAAEDPDTGETIVAYHEFHIKPGMTGFVREFVDKIPSPYDCDLDQLDALPVFDPDEHMRENKKWKAQWEKDNPVTSQTSGTRNATYGAAPAADLTAERWQSDFMDLEQAKSLQKDWIASEMTWDDVDGMLFNAHRNTIWWEPDDTTDLSKAPNMWRGDDQVPEFVKEFIREVIKGGVIYDTFDGLPHTAAIKMQEIFEENLTQAGGWSTESLVNDITEAFKGLGQAQAIDIVRMESAAILNTAREEAYKARPDSEEYEYYWSNPDDQHTTDTCHEIMDEIKSRGGAVPLDELKQILKDAAQNHPHEGTPNRADEYVPHFNCRSTFVREVYL